MIPSQQQQTFSFENICSYREEEHHCFRNYNNVRKFVNVFLIILFCYFSYRIIWIVMDGLLYFFLSFICICAFKWNNGWNWNQLKQYVCESISSSGSFICKYFPKMVKKKDPNHSFFSASSLSRQENNDEHQYHFPFSTSNKNKKEVELNFIHTNYTNSTTSSLSNIHI